MQVDQEDREPAEPDEQQRVEPGRPAPEAEDPGDDVRGLIERFGAEEDPREAHEMESQKRRPEVSQQMEPRRGGGMRRANLFVRRSASRCVRVDWSVVERAADRGCALGFSADRTVDAQVEAVEPAPDHEPPRSAVPQAAEEHRDHQVAIGREAALPVPAERHVEVVAQPGRKRDVPRPPELRDVSREIRLVEVLEQLDAEQARGSAGDVAVAGEVAVDLEGEPVHAEHERRRADPARVCERGVDRRRERVGDRDLLEQSQQDEEDPGPDLRPMKAGSAGARTGEAAPARGRSGRPPSCGKNETKSAKSRRRWTGSMLAAVHVERVRDPVERVEGDPDRKQDAERRRVRVEPQCVSRSAPESTKKLKYLKNPRMPRFTARLTKKMRLRRRSSSVAASSRPTT